MDDLERQIYEVEALKSIYDSEEELCVYDNDTSLISIQFYAFVDLPENFKVILFNDKQSDAGCSEDDGDCHCGKCRLLSVQYLPPIELTAKLPKDYPSKSSPKFNLSCAWLSASMLLKLCQKLDEIWKENEMSEILFLWIRFLKVDSLSYFGLNDRLKICLSSLKADECNVKKQAAVIKKLLVKELPATSTELKCNLDNIETCSDDVYNFSRDTGKMLDSSEEVGISKRNERCIVVSDTVPNETNNVCSTENSSYTKLDAEGSKSCGDQIATTSHSIVESKQNFNSSSRKNTCKMNHERTYYGRSFYNRKYSGSGYKHNSNPAKCVPSCSSSVKPNDFQEGCDTKHSNSSSSESDRNNNSSENRSNYRNRRANQSYNNNNRFRAKTGKQYRYYRYRSYNAEYNESIGDRVQENHCKSGGSKDNIYCDDVRNNLSNEISNLQNKFDNLVCSVENSNDLQHLVTQSTSCERNEMSKLNNTENSSVLVDKIDDRDNDNIVKGPSNSLMGNIYGQEPICVSSVACNAEDVVKPEVRDNVKNDVLSDINKRDNPLVICNNEPTVYNNNNNNDDRIGKCSSQYYLHNFIEYLEEYNEDRILSEFRKKYFDCSICYESKKGLLSMQFKPCGHVFCKECIGRFIQGKIDDGAVYVIKCPENKCNSVVTPSQVREVVGPEQFAKYDSLLLETTLQTMTDITICPRSACQYPVTREPDEKMATCPACKYAFCVFCRMVYHGIEACRLRNDEKAALVKKYVDAGDEEKLVMEQRYGKKQLVSLVQASLSESWIVSNSQNCPHCNASIEKNGGCNKMVCWRCSTYFCWICQTQLDPSCPYIHYNDRNSRCYKQLFQGVDISDDEDDFDFFIINDALDE